MKSLSMHLYSQQITSYLYNSTIPMIRICEKYIECSLHIYIEHRNPETRKTLTTSQFRYETFYYL